MLCVIALVSGIVVHAAGRLYSSDNILPMQYHGVNTIEAYESEIRSQPEFLRSFKMQEPIPEDIQAECVFSGSGDSLASAMLAESFSAGRVRAMDPLDLYRSRALVQSRRPYIVSISGETVAGVKAARLAGNATAITAKPQGRLARAAGSTILLDFPGSGVFTAGSVSFLASALTCVSLVRRFRMPDPAALFSKAESDAADARMSGRHYILGGMAAYPIAMYCAAKFYETAGLGAHYCRTEQFSHMELFSACRGDTVVMLDKKSKYGQSLSEGLRGAGINVVSPDIPSGDIPAMIYRTFLSQLLSLRQAKAEGRNECHFVTARDMRGISNTMIY